MKKKELKKTLDLAQQISANWKIKADNLKGKFEELKEGYECALSHIKTLNDGVLMSQNIWDEVIAQAYDLLNND